MLTIALAACSPRPGPEAPAIHATTTSDAAASASASAYPPPATPLPLAPVQSAEPALPNDREVISEALQQTNELVRGRATVRVDAPLERVRAVVLSFNDYAAFMPHYRTSRILDRAPNETLVYMQVAALGGLVKMGANLWFPKTPTLEGGWEAYASRFDGGNVEDFQAIWRLRARDERSTYLSLEVYLLPKLPLPKSTLDDENTKGARNGAAAMRQRIEGS